MKEIQSITDMDVDVFNIKGNIKVDSEELRTMLRYVQQYHAMWGDRWEQLTPEEQKMLQQGLRFTEYFQNKYIVLVEIRQSQKFYYDMLQKMKEEDYIKGHSEEEIEDLRRQVWGMYIEAKDRRETLQKEIEELERKIE